MDNEEVYLNDLSCDPSHFGNLEALFHFVTEEGRASAALEGSEAERGPNPTAANYFFRIVETLTGLNEVALLSYVFSHKDILKVLVDRADVRPFANLLANLVHFTKDEDRIDASFKFLKYRFTLIRRIFETLLDLPAPAETGSLPQRDELAAKERALVRILEEFAVSREKIVDADYFLDKILTEKKHFKRLLAAVASRQSPELLRLATALLGYLFEKSAVVASRKADVEARGRLDSARPEIEEDKIELELPELKRPAHRGTDNYPRDASMTTRQPPAHEALMDPEPSSDCGGGEFSPDRRDMLPPVTPDQIETPPNGAEDDSQSDTMELPTDNKSTAETSKGPVHNIEIDFYDNAELTKTKIAVATHRCIKALLKELLVADSSAPRTAFSRGVDENRPTGPYRIALVKFLAAALELQKVEECIPSLFKLDVLGRLADLFQENPVNNLFHIHLTRLLDVLVAHAFHYDPEAVDLEPFCDRLAALLRNTGPDAPKTIRSKHLYRASIFQLVSSLRVGFASSGSHQLTPPASWKTLSDFWESETKLMDNKLFAPVPRTFAVSESLPDNFEINNFKINTIIEKRQRQQLLEDEFIEATPPAYQSNHIDVNMDMLNSLIDSLSAETDKPADADDPPKDLLSYEVELDLQPEVASARMEAALSPTEAPRKERAPEVVPASSEDPPADGPAKDAE